jgi:hypothetical protein
MHGGTHVSVTPTTQGPGSTEEHTTNASTAAAGAPKTYSNTGIQTLPPKSARQFEHIYGREPNEREILRKIGGAAIGRFTEDTNPHEVVYGTPFLVAANAQTGKNLSYMDSGFQTFDAARCKKSLARAKIKASMMVSKQRWAAQAAGYRVWAESKDGKIIHSERFGTNIQFDKHGNATDSDTGGLLLPNIYGEEIVSSISSTPITLHSQRESSPSFQPSIENHVDTHVYSPTSGIPPQATPPPPPIPFSHSNRISALEPSLREADADPEPIEDYGYSREDSDEAVDEFVIYQAMEPASIMQENPSSFSPDASHKRKIDILHEYDSAQNSPKRPGTLRSSSMADRLLDRMDPNARIEQREQIDRTREESQQCFGSGRIITKNMKSDREGVRRRERFSTADSESSFRESRRDRSRDPNVRTVRDESEIKSQRQRSRSPTDTDHRPIRISVSGNGYATEVPGKEERPRRRASREYNREGRRSSRSRSIRMTDSNRKLSASRDERKTRDANEAQSKTPDSHTRGRRNEPHIAFTEDQNAAQLEPQRHKAEEEMEQARAAKDRRRKTQDEAKGEREVENLRRLEQEKLKRTREAEDRKKLDQERSRQEQEAKELAAETMKREREAEDRRRKERENQRRTRETNNRRHRYDHSTNENTDARRSGLESVIEQEKPVDFFAEAREAENRRRLLAQTGSILEPTGRRERSTKKEDERRKPEKKTEVDKIQKPRTGRAPRVELERYDPRKKFGRQ